MEEEGQFDLCEELRNEINRQHQKNMEYLNSGKDSAMSEQDKQSALILKMLDDELKEQHRKNRKYLDFLEDSKNPEADIRHLDVLNALNVETVRQHKKNLEYLKSLESPEKPDPHQEHLKAMKEVEEAIKEEHRKFAEFLKSQEDPETANQFNSPSEQIPDSGKFVKKQSEAERKFLASLDVKLSTENLAISNKKQSVNELDAKKDPLKPISQSAVEKKFLDSLNFLNNPESPEVTPRDRDSDGVDNLDLSSEDTEDILKSSPKIIHQHSNGKSEHHRKTNKKVTKNKENYE